MDKKTNRAVGFGEEIEATTLHGQENKSSSGGRWWLKWGRAATWLTVGKERGRRRWWGGGGGGGAAGGRRGVEAAAAKMPRACARVVVRRERERGASMRTEYYDAKLDPLQLEANGPNTIGVDLT
uniref:Uncharacterized protein n=1 Tax=Oryza sativa subsp. japonica TaxID=39947 RepID=Q6K495_ORYSJ|nr:hypothetical protein [Oryza sativa Japonica Group]BAD22274.1 hypothetical protein [Oryza sativa Japonica Group]